MNKNINFDFASLYPNVQKSYDIFASEELQRMYEELMKRKKIEEREKKLRRILGDES
jgi:hypothetical protein